MKINVDGKTQVIIISDGHLEKLPQFGSRESTSTQLLQYFLYREFGETWDFSRCPEGLCGLQLSMDCINQRGDRIHARC
jgi:hypothetical protein